MRIIITKDSTATAIAAAAAIECACLYTALKRYGFSERQFKLHIVGETEETKHVVLQLHAQRKTIALVVCSRGDGEVFTAELRRLLKVYVANGDMPLRNYRASLAYKELLDKLLDQGFTINRR